MFRTIQALMQDDKQGLSPHPSCLYPKQNDEYSKTDSVFNKCQNAFPQYQFNNLGVAHLKLQKYNLAIYYFSKALKFTERSFSGNPSVLSDCENPNEHISHLNSQKTSEILYNYGLVTLISIISLGPLQDRQIRRSIQSI